MLSDQNRPVIEATLPVVGEHIGKIAERFYGHLFTEHPELVDGTFNRGNQASGEQQQALAGSVAAFASSLIETPERVPQSLLSRIAHKHASLASAPTSTKSCTTTSCGRSSTYWAMRSPRRSPPRGTRSTG